MFGFPAQQKQEDFGFKRNFLRTVVFQVKYEKVSDFTARQAEIIALLSPLFPIASVPDGRAFEISIDKGTPVISDVEDSSGVLEFRDAKQQKVCAVSSDTVSLTIAGNAYINFKQVQRELDDSVYAVINLLRINKFTRLAIRKVNLVSVGASNPELPKRLDELLRTVFNNDLLNSILSVPASQYLLTTVSNSRFTDGINNLNIIYGLLPQQNVEGKEKDFRELKHLILDLDVFILSTFSSIEELRDNLKKINDAAYDVFVWSLAPQFLQSLSS